MPRAPQVHLLRRLCDRFGVSLANEVLQETLTVEVRRNVVRRNVASLLLTPS